MGLFKRNEEPLYIEEEVKRIKEKHPDSLYIGWAGGIDSYNDETWYIADEIAEGTCRLMKRYEIGTVFHCGIGGVSYIFQLIADRVLGRELYERSVIALLPRGIEHHLTEGSREFAGNSFEERDRTMMKLVDCSVFIGSAFNHTNAFGERDRTLDQLDRAIEYGTRIIVFPETSTDLKYKINPLAMEKKEKMKIINGVGREAVGTGLNHIEKLFYSKKVEKNQ